MDEKNVNSEDEMQNNEPQADEKNTCVTNEMLEEKNKYPYNYNPFTPHGRINRSRYFITMISIGIISHAVIAYDQNFKMLYTYLIVLGLMIPQLFVIKKRILDITFDSKKSWWFAVGAFILMLIPFINFIVGLCLLFAKGKYDKKLGEQ